MPSKQLKQLAAAFQQAWQCDSANQRAPYKDDRKAMEIYKALSARDYAPAQYHLGKIYEQGRANLPPNPSQALHYYQLAAHGGNKLAQYALALIYEEGHDHVIKDEKMAVYWYEQSAENDYGLAQYVLANKYEKGIGCPQNQDKALYWYERASAHHIPQATDKVIILTERKKQQPTQIKIKIKTVPAYSEQCAQEEKDFQYYRDRAQAGEAQAQNVLGMFYQKGRIVEQNDEKAVAWYEKAAAQGNPSAQYNLGVMNEDGHGCPQNDEKAVDLFTKAVQGGNIKAYFALAKMYEKGWGCPQDDALAERCYIEAIQHHKKTLKNLKTLAQSGNKIAQSALNNLPSDQS